MLRKVMLTLAATAALGAAALMPNSASACGYGCWHRHFVRHVVHVVYVRPIYRVVRPIYVRPVEVKPAADCCGHAYWSGNPGCWW